VRLALNGLATISSQALSAMAESYRRRQRGFSLLEILVAFSILALSLGVLMQIFSGSLNNAETTHERAQAVLLAQSLLSAAGVEAPLATQTSAGVHGGKYRWRLSVGPYAEAGVSGNPDILRQVLPMDLWQVSVSVEWDPGRVLTLSTLRAQPMVRP
jgi:general secretion pathway protein I